MMNCKRRAFLAILFIGCASFTAGAADVPAASKRKVLVFGDSITAGNALPKEERASAWPSVVERDSGGALQMINEGKGGRPTASVEEFRAAVARHADVQVVVVALGTNDSRDLTKECAPKAAANVRAMVQHAREKYGSQTTVLLVGPPNLNKSTLGPTKPIGKEREEKLRELGEAFSKLAKELGCDFVTLFGAVPETSMSRDGVHPDAAGNAAIAKVVGGKLRELAR